MASIEPSVFLTRDVLEHLLPTLLAVILLLPFALSPGQSPEYDSILLASVVLAYVVGALSQAVVRQPWIALSLAGFYSLLGTKSADTIEHIRNRSDWWARNLDMDLLFNSLSKDEREYFYLTRAYLRLFQISSLYLVLYGALNILWWLGRAYIDVTVFQKWKGLLLLSSPILGGWNAPSLLLSLLSMICFGGLYSWYVLEYQSLFSDWGSHVQMAKRYQREQGNIATGIWGQLKPKELVRDASVDLLHEGNIAHSGKADKDGWFQFPGTYQESIGKQCKLRIRLQTGVQYERDIEVLPAEVPEFIVSV